MTATATVTSTPPSPPEEATSRSGFTLSEPYDHYRLTTKTQTHSSPSYASKGSAVPTPRKMSEAMSVSSSGSGAVVTIGSKPTLITASPMRFLIMDAPRQSNLHLYIKECRKYGVTDCVRVCDPTYLAGDLKSAGITLHEMAYQDGMSPPEQILDDWLSLVGDRFYVRTDKLHKDSSFNNRDDVVSDSTATSSSPDIQDKAIAVHCVAGLGRAPVLVAIALIEYANMDPVEAVTFIRRHRRGAINEKQLIYLESYKRRFKGLAGGAAGCSCVLM